MKIKLITIITLCHLIGAQGYLLSSEQLANNLSIEISSLRDVYDFGDIITLNIKFNNNSNKTLKIPLNNNVSVSKDTRLDLIVKSEDFDGQNTHIANDPFLSSLVVVLSPKQSTSLEIQGLILWPGANEIKIVYEHEFEVDATIKDNPVDGLWRGEVVSNILSLDVKWPDEKKIAELQQKYEEIYQRLEKYPLATQNRHHYIIACYLPISSEYVKKVLINGAPAIQIQMLYNIGRAYRPKSESDDEYSQKYLPALLDVGSNDNTVVITKEKIASLLSIARYCSDNNLKSRTIQLLKSYAASTDNIGLSIHAFHSLFLVDKKAGSETMQKLKSENKIDLRHYNSLSSILKKITGEYDMEKALEKIRTEYE